MTKQIQIGGWDSAGTVIEVADNCTIGQALVQAGIQLQAAERITALNSNSLQSMDSLVSDGEQYVITQNHVSG